MDDEYTLFSGKCLETAAAPDLCPIHEPLTILGHPEVEQRGVIGLTDCRLKLNIQKVIEYNKIEPLEMRSGLTVSHHSFDFLPWFGVDYSQETGNKSSQKANKRSCIEPMIDQFFLANAGLHAQ